MGWMMLGMVLFWGLVIFLAILLVRALFETGDNRSPKEQEVVSPMEVLDLRYSRGEINQEQYSQMRKDLEQTSVEI